VNTAQTIASQTDRRILETLRDSSAVAWETREAARLQLAVGMREPLIRQEHETQLECVPSAGQMNLF
jgi:hypothetical protein